MTLGSSFSRFRSALVVLLAGVLVPLVVVPPVQADDLATLARKEKERRAKIAKQGKVLTEADGKDAAVKGSGSFTATTEQKATPESANRQVGVPAETSDGQKAAWKARADSARAAVAEAEKKLGQMEKDLATLMSDMAPLSAAEAQDPMRLQKRDALRVTLNKLIEGQKAEVVTAQKALAALDDEARKNGVPAGWLRD